MNQDYQLNTQNGYYEQDHHNHKKNISQIQHLTNLSHFSNISNQVIIPPLPSKQQQSNSNPNSNSNQSIINLFTHSKNSLKYISDGNQIQPKYHHHNNGSNFNTYNAHNKYHHSQQKIIKNSIPRNTQLLKSKNIKQTLLFILNKAEKNYQRQNKLSFSTPPSFNILRVLSAYKQMCPNNNAQVYNLIIYIIQNYKPKTVQNWYQALESIYSLKSYNNSKSKSKQNSKSNQKSKRCLSIYSCFNNQNLNNINNLSNIVHTPYGNNQKQKLTSRSSTNTKILLANFIQNCQHKKHSDVSSFLQSQSRILSNTDRTEEPQPIKLNFNSVNQNNIFEMNSVDNQSNNQNHFKGNKAHYVSFQPIDQAKQYQQFYDNAKCKETRGSVGNTHSHQFSDPNMNMTQNFIERKSNYDIQMDMNKSSLQFMKSKHQKSQSSFQLHKKLSKSMYKNHQYQFSHPQFADSNNTYTHTPSTALNRQTPFAVSKITQNTKQLFELSKINNIAQQNQNQYQQEYHMNLRGAIFYRINTSMKTFSALLANYSAFYQYRQAKNKARHFYHDNIKRKAVQSLKKYSFEAKIQRQLIKNAIIYRNEILIKKSLSVLKVLYSTKICNRRKLPQVSSFNLASLSFIELLILKQLQQKFSTRSKQENQVSFMKRKLHQTINNQNLPETINVLNSNIGSITPKYLQHKADYFTSTGQINKLHQLLDCFTSYRPQMKEMEKFYKIKNRKILQLCIKSWIKFTKKRTLYSKKHKDTLKLKSFIILKKRVLKRKQYLKNQEAIKILNQTKLMKKSFNILLQIVCTNKIFEKKQKIIRLKNQKNLKENILSKWRENLEKRQKNRQNFYKACQLIQKINQTISLQNSFLDMFKYAEYMKEKAQKIEQLERLKLLSNIFQVFKNKIKISKQIKKITQLNEKNKTQKLFIIWKTVSFTNQILQKTQKIWKKLCFEKIKSLNQYIIKKQAFETSANNSIKSEFFNAWKQLTYLNIIQLDNKKIKFLQFLMKCCFKNLISNSSFSSNKKKLITFNKKRKYLSFFNSYAQVSSNLFQKKQVSQLRQNFLTKSKISFFEKLRQQTFSNLQAKKNKKHLQSYIIAKKIKNAFEKCRNQFDFSKNSNNLKQSIQNRSKNIAKLCLRSQIMFTKCNKFFKNNENKKKERVFNIFKQQRNKIICSYQDADNLYKMNIKKKVLLGIVQQLIKADKKINQLTQIYKKQKKTQSLLYLIKHNKKNKDIKNKFNTCVNSRFVNSLKMIKQNSQKQLEIEQFLCRSRQVSTLKLTKINYQYIKNSYLNKIKLDKNTLLVSSMIFMNRLNKFFIQKMLNRKLQTSALIFRCQKLQQKSLKGIQQYYCTRKGISLTQLEKLRNNISTQISFS